MDRKIQAICSRHFLSDLTRGRIKNQVIPVLVMRVDNVIQLRVCKFLAINFNFKIRNLVKVTLSHL